MTQASEFVANENDALVPQLYYVMLQFVSFNQCDRMWGNLKSFRQYFESLFYIWQLVTQSRQILFVIGSLSLM